MHPLTSSRRGEGLSSQMWKLHAMERFISDPPTPPSYPADLIVESATTREAKQPLLLLDPAGLECLPRVPAASRGEPRFSSKAASREALPHILAYWLCGSHSSWAPPLLQLDTFLKPLHYHPDETNMEDLMLGNCSRAWNTVNTHKYRAQLAGCYPNQRFLHNAPSTLADPHASKAYKLLRGKKKEFDKEKDSPRNAGSLSITQEYDVTLNLNVASTTGDIIVTQSGLFSEHLNAVNLSENIEDSIYSSDHACFLLRLSLQPYLSDKTLTTTSTKMLVQHAYEKKGMRNYDGYAVYLGKVLDDNMFLADCKLCNNCTLEVRGRGRGGEKEVRILCKTFDEEMKDVELFSMVPFPKTLTNTQTLKTSATFLSVPCQWRARQVLISLGRLHFRGKSFNGKFNANHILFYDGRVVFDECLKEVDFTKDTGKNDCRVIAGIYGHKFRVPGEESYPLFVLDLLWYLSECPLGDKSNSVAGIALLVSHPALTTFIDRMGQVSTLDSMVDRFTEKDLGLFDIAVGKFETWGAIANNVPAMWKTLAHDPRKKDADSEANPEAINDPRKMDADSEADPEAINWERTSYTDQPRSCLKFCRNHLKHTHISNLLERVEGSLCLNFGDFLPQMLRDIVQKFDPPPP